MTTSPDLLVPVEAKILLSTWNQSRDLTVTLYPFNAISKNTSNSNAPVETERDVSMIVIQFIYAIVCLIGLIGNSMVIFVILRYAKMKTATNIYILNLAIADELFMLSVPFLAASAALQHWPFGSGMCRTVLSVDGINMFTSVFCLTVLSVDRYVAVVHPLRAARYRRPTVAKMINICVWIVSLLVISPILIFADTESSKNGVVVCNLMWPQPAWSTVFVIYTFLLGFFLPVVAICLCYVLIIFKMRAVALKAGWQQRKKSEKKITRMVLMVVTVFVICWMPFYIVQLLNLFLPQMDSSINHISIILSYANSCANPILYGFFSDNFKRSFQRIVCFRWIENGTDEPVDYYATALKSKVCNNHPLDFQQEPLQSDPCYKHGTITRTTTL
ncbi:PREDICTED: somatostatin receptor type 4-like [Nanorana parkeri]|uniref:somatostatin receptor type 4-like n=1 Tax=Nanorana parkeri TaxID=125878 RepID=UPI000854B996|nr:PREDICTED: somatostatin receptor type 4-like [Nanorana parkeri]XP_018422214.1 PREDICTED: somatostatin receptor type 4-like [Nanorana parkeri]